MFGLRRTDRCSTRDLSHTGLQTRLEEHGVLGQCGIAGSMWYLLVWRHHRTSTEVNVDMEAADTPCRETCLPQNYAPIRCYKASCLLSTGTFVVSIFSLQRQGQGVMLELWPWAQASRQFRLSPSLAQWTKNWNVPFGDKCLLLRNWISPKSVDSGVYQLRRTDRRSL